MNLNTLSARLINDGCTRASYPALQVMAKAGAIPARKVKRVWTVADADYPIVKRIFSGA